MIIKIETIDETIYIDCIENLTVTRNSNNKVVKVSYREKSGYLEEIVTKNNTTVNKVHLIDNGVVLESVEILVDNELKDKVIDFLNG